MAKKPTARFKPKPIQVEQDPDAPMPKRMLAQEIAKLGAACRVLIRCGLEREDLALILQRRTNSRVTITDVRNVLDAVEKLGRDYAQAV